MFSNVLEKTRNRKLFMLTGDKREGNRILYNILRH